MLHQLVDDFLYSHYPFGGQCIDMVRRNYILITPGSENGLKQNKIAENRLLSALGNKQSKARYDETCMTKPSNAWMETKLQP